MRIPRRAENCVCCPILFLLLIALGEGHVLGMEQATSAATTSATSSATRSSDPEFRNEMVGLITELGASTYRKREAATEELLEIGPPALPSLREGLEHSDIEIRTRSRRIVAEIEHAQRQQLMQRFLSSSESIDPAKLPGWNRFVESVVSSDRIRSAYTSMMREEWFFVEDAVNGGSVTASKYLANRCRSLQSEIRVQKSKIAEGTMCALLFIASLDEVEIPHAGILLGFCTRSECQNYFARGEHREILNGLLVKVIRKPLGESTLAQRIYLSSRYGLKDGIEIARDVVSDTSVRTYVRQSAILLIARFGKKSDRELLKPLLSDTTISIQARNVQIRDIALAALIHMHGERVEDYGFKDVRRENSTVYSPSTLSFKSDADRGMALSMWFQRHGG